MTSEAKHRFEGLGLPALLLLSRVECGPFTNRCCTHVMKLPLKLETWKLGALAGQQGTSVLKVGFLKRV